MMFKRTVLFLLLCALCLTAAACGETEESVPDAESSAENAAETKDTVPPEFAGAEDGKLSPVTHRIDESMTLEKVLALCKLNVKDDISLKRNITVEVTDDGGYDPMTAGVYMMTVRATDEAGNFATVTVEVTVTKTEVLSAYPVWEGEIADEVKNPSPSPVFGGAWYYKTVSARDKWVGIETTVTLPEIDIDRYKSDYDTSQNVDPNVQNLDNPSIYLGGNAISESDVGLSLSKVALNSSGTISTGSVAFRPFWRYITDENQDVGGYDVHGGEYAVTANGNNCFANYHWKYTEYYYLPGDTLRIIVHIPEEGKMQLQIEVLEVSTLASSVEMREKYGWKAPQNFVSPVFTSPGHGTGMDVEFKRVCAIDQSGNEGGTAIASSTEVKHVIWHETYLYREIDGTVYRVAMDETRRASTAAPDADKFTVSYDGVDTDKGGEVVSIHPGRT